MTRCLWCLYALVPVLANKRKGKAKSAPGDSITVRCEFCGEAFLVGLDGDKTKRKLQSVYYKSTLEERYTKEKIFAAWQWIEFCPCADALVNLQDISVSEQARPNYYQQRQQKPSSRRAREYQERREKAIAFIQGQHRKARELPGALSFPLYEEIERIEKQFSDHWWGYEDSDERKIQWGIKHGPLWEPRLKAYSKAARHAHGRAACERLLFGSVLEGTESELRKITEVEAKWTEEKKARYLEEQEKKAARERERMEREERDRQQREQQQRELTEQRWRWS